MALRRKTLRILVVDDNSDHATSLTMLLQQQGYDVSGCDYSKNCMAIVEGSRPDVILLDLAMPGMTGFDIADELRLNPDLRPSCLIAVTGHGQPSDRERTKASGFDHHMVKPIDLDELRLILGAVPLKGQ